METKTTIRSIPSAAEARQQPLAKTVRRAASASERDGRPYYVTATNRGYSIVRSEGGLKFSSYFRVFADHAEMVEPVR
jgi:hypothetical protein